MDLRAGSPAVERRTWSRSLRGPILAGPSPSCAHDDDRLRFPPVSPAQNSKAGKKESTGRRRDRHCPPCARPSSNSSLDQRHSDARAAENGFAAKSSVNKSAKVVLGRVLINRDCSAITGCRKRRVQVPSKALSDFLPPSRRPPLAKMRPGNPAPAIGPGTAISSIAFIRQLCQLRFFGQLM